MDQQPEIDRGRERGDNWTYYLPPPTSFKFSRCLRSLSLGCFTSNTNPEEQLWWRCRYYKYRRDVDQDFQGFIIFFNQLVPGLRLVMSGTQKLTPYYDHVVVKLGNYAHGPHWLSVTSCNFLTVSHLVLVFARSSLEWTVQFSLHVKLTKKNKQKKAM